MYMHVGNLIVLAVSHLLNVCMHIASSVCYNIIINFK